MRLKAWLIISWSCLAFGGYEEDLLEEENRRLAEEWNNDTAFGVGSRANDTHPGQTITYTYTTSTTTTTTTTTANADNTFNYNGRAYTYGDIFTFAGSAYASGGDYYFYGVATSLTGHLTPGATTLPVATNAGFNIGDTILIGNVELKTITGFSSIIINSGLVGTHASGTPIVAVRSASGTAGADPVAIFGETRREFWLPLGVMHPILYMPELTMMASTFPGQDGEQWFERVVINSAGGFQIADISIKRDIAQFNKTATARNAFETLDVKLGGSDVVMEHMPDLDYVFDRMGVYINFMRMDQMQRPIANQMRIQRARRDVVMVATKTAHLLITASPASEYSNFRPDLAVQYSHVDIIVLEMRHQNKMKGLLPELWGIKPMSNRTKSFLVDPRENAHKRAASQVEDLLIHQEGHVAKIDIAKDDEETRFLAARESESVTIDAEEDGKSTTTKRSASTESCSLLEDGTKPMACVL